jgi:adenylate cyclase class 2
MAWLEVETKVKIDDYSSFKKKIEKIAKLSKKEIKIDNYFSINKKGYPEKAFRVREKNNKYEINFKKWVKKYWTPYIVVKEEFEFGTDDPENLIFMMRDLGFSKWLKKEKKCLIYTYNKNKKASIELNKVKRLGNFIEVEYLCQAKELSKAKKTIMQILKELDIKKEQIDNTGYTKLLWKKKH